MSVENPRFENNKRETGEPWLDQEIEWRERERREKMTPEQLAEDDKRKEENELLEKILEEPHSDEVWRRAVELASEEESSGGGLESYYSKIPLVDLIAIGERIRATESKDEQYAILAEKLPTGEYWYDVILGHVNDKTFVPVKEKLESMAESSKDKNLGAGLDVGSGFGNTLRAIAPCFKKVVGVEKLASLAELTEKDSSMPKNAEVVCADATKLPFADGTFDVAVSNGLTHYLKRDEMKEYVDEISRVLKDGGKYFEALTAKRHGERLPITETEYLTSAKALLVYLINNIVSKVDHGDNGDPSWYLSTVWNFTEMIIAFRENGVYYSEPSKNQKDAGIVTAEFKKDKKWQATLAKFQGNQDDDAKKDKKYDYYDRD